MIFTIEKELGGLDLLNIKNFYIVIVIRTIWYWSKHTSETEYSPETIINIWILNFSELKLPLEDNIKEYFHDFSIGRCLKQDTQCFTHKGKD